MIHNAGKDLSARQESYPASSGGEESSCIGSPVPYALGDRYQQTRRIGEAVQLNDSVTAGSHAFLGDAVVALRW